MPLLKASKVLCSETLAKVTLDALQIFGGLGAMKELPMERYHLDSLILLHGRGTADVFRVKLNRLLAAEDVIG